MGAGQNHQYAIAYADHAAATYYDTEWQLTRVQGSATSATVTVEIEIDWQNSHINKAVGTSVGVAVAVTVSGIEGGVSIFVNENHRVVVEAIIDEEPQQWISDAEWSDEVGTVTAQFNTTIAKDAFVRVQGVSGVGGMAYGDLGGSSAETIMSLDIRLTAN